MPNDKWTMAGPRVRWRELYDDVPYDDSYIDTWDDMSDEQVAEEKRLLWERIKYEGVYGYIIEVLKDVALPHCKGVTHQQWEEHWACFGFIGSDGLEELEAELRTLI